MARSVMVVDDDLAILSMIGDLLQDAGYDIYLVSNPMDAVAVAYAERPGLILLDLMMPALSGGVVLNLLRERAATSRIPVVLVSGMDGLGGKVTELGAAGCIPKPFDPDALLALVAQTIKP